MPRHNTIFLAIALSFSQTNAFGIEADCKGAGCADSPDWSQCGVPQLFDFYRADLPRDADRLSSEALLQAEQFDVSDQAQYQLIGNPTVERADQYLQADHMTFMAEADKVTAEGKVRYQDRDFLFRAEKAETLIEAKKTTVDKMSYQLLSARGNGDASSAVIEGDGKSRLQAVSYSSCEPGQHAWEIRADQIDLDQESGIGTARGMRLKVRDTTVFYWPYGSFPITDERKSGFLMPGLGGGGNNGIDFILPYYLNLAPNFDATISPRIMGKRGLMLGGEFRFLGDHNIGMIDFSYLPSDREANRDRGSFSFKDVITLTPNFNIVADLNHVSDDRYFEDFGDSLTGVATSLLPSNIYLNGRGSWWTLALGADQIEITDPRLPDAAEPYRRLPRLTFNFEKPIGEHFLLGANSEFVRFDKSNYRALASSDGLDEITVKPITGNRLDLYPYLAFPFEGASYFVRPQLGVRYTGYNLDQPSNANIPGPPVPFDRSLSRTTPIGSLDAGLIFERPMTWGESNYTQTLEPRLYYLYAKNRLQNDLPVFDTQELTFGFAQLFRDNRFTGADRQTDANQITTALSSRIYQSEDGVERARFSLGRIQYFDAPTVQLPGITALDLSGSDYIGEVEFGFSDDWSVLLTHQYDPEQSQTDFSAFRVQRRFADRGVINAGYRYRRNFLEQADVSAAWPVSPNWRIVSRWNYSLFDDRTLEAFLGLEYNSCCTAFRILGRHFVRNVEGETNNALYFELELKGLGTLGRKSEQLLRRAILGYR